MKKITLLMALIVSAFSLQVSAQNFEGDTGFIPDNGCPFQTEFGADVTGIGNVGDLKQIDEVVVNITHTWIGDVQMVLIAPDGTELDLFLGLGFNSGDNMVNTVFSDEGNPPVINPGGGAPYTGVFAPMGGTFADAFNGVNGDGEWQLAACDAAAFDEGTVDQWSIRFQDNPESCPAPFNLNVTDLMSTTMTINWDAITAADAYQYAVMNDGDAPTTTSGTPPNAVQSGQTTDLTADVIGLTAATTYDVYVRSVCNGTPGPWTNAFEVTTEDTCPAPTDLDISEVTASTITFTWTAANNSSGYDWEVVEAGDAPFAGNDVDSGSTTGTTDTATGLDEQTSYEVWVRNNCDTDGNSTNVGPVATTTGCAIIVLNSGDSYEMDFTGTAGPNTDPACWTQNGTYVWDYNSPQNNGSSYGTAFFSALIVDNTDNTGLGDYAVCDPIQPAIIFGTNDGTNAGVTNLDSPNFDISDLTGPSVTMALHNFVDPFFSDNFGVSNNTLNVQVSTDSGASFTTVLTVDSNTTTTAGNSENFETVTLDLDGLGVTGSTLQVRFEVMFDGIFNFVSHIVVDDFVVEELGCRQPLDTEVVDVEATSATLNFVGFSTAVNGHFYALVEPGVDPEVGPYIQSGNLAAGVETVDLVLEPLTCYEAYVRAICDGETSGFGPAVEFCTPGLCDEPGDVDVDNITNNSVDVSWDAVDGVASYDYLLTVVGGDPDTAADVVAGTSGNTTDTAVTISPIADATSYTAWVRSVCDEDGNTSIWTSSDDFMTEIGCNANFYDTGGVAGDYGDRELYTVTLMPSENASALTLTFTLVDLEFGEDFLSVYNGTDTSQPFTLDLQAPASFTSTDASGAITVMFESDGAGVGAGWEAMTSCSILNDFCATAIELIPDVDFDSSATEVSNQGATDSGVTDPSCGFYGGGDIWYTVEVPESGSITIETQETVTGTVDIQDTGIAVYTGTCGSLTEIACDDDNGIGSFSVVSLTGLTAGDTLYIRAWGSDTAGLFGDFQIAAYDASLSTGDLEAAGFNFYPNPVVDQLNLSAQDNIQNVEVFNLLGQSVIKSTPNALNARVDMANLNTGVYIVNVTINNQTGAYRVIKQ